MTKQQEKAESHKAGAMREYPADGIMLCKDCGTKMGRSGKPLSGRHRIQAWKCSNCGWVGRSKLEEGK